MIRFRTLGSLDLRAPDGGELSAVLAQPKRVALLAFLALARPGGFHRRDRLLSLFWPELDQTHARDSLNQAIRFLRQVLGAGVLISRGGDEIALDREHLSCDAAEFRSAIDEGRFADALDLYRGDLLDGLFASDARGFEEWLETERAELRELAARAAWTLAEQQEGAGNMTRALRLGRQAAALASDDERVVRRWIAMLVRAGDRAGAMKVYEEFARRLATEYETEPSAETRALLDAIRRDPEANRYADGKEFRQAIRQPTTESQSAATSQPSVPAGLHVDQHETIIAQRLTWRPAARRGAVAAIVLATVVVAWGASRTLGIGPAARVSIVGATDRVFVADFEPPARDAELGDVATELLMAAIGRNASIPLVDANQRQLTLLALGLPDSTRIFADRAREFASRANAKVYLAGAIDRVGSAYILRATLRRTEDGTEVQRFRREAESADDYIRAIDQLGRDVRSGLGAALSEVRGAPELVWAVTPSLAAARFYSAAKRRSTITGDLGASSLSLLERAVAEDSTFAMAYWAMSSWSGNAGNPGRAVWAAERAFRYRDKLPRHLQLSVEGLYYSQPVAAYDLDKAIAAYEAAAEIFPGGPDGHNRNSLAILYVRKRDFERAVSLYREALRLDSTSFASQNILVPLWATGRKEEARTHVARNLARLSSTSTFLWAKSYLASADFFIDSAVAILDHGTDEFRDNSRVRGAVHLLLMSPERARGHIASALQHRDSAVSLGQSSDTAGNAAATALLRANVLAWDLGRPVEARRLLERFEASHPPGNAGPMAYRWLDLAQAFAQAGAPAKAHALLATYERKATAGQKNRTRSAIELVRGEIAMAERRYADAIAAFRAADVGSCTICALAPLAHAYDRAGNADSAIAVSERYLTTNAWSRIDTDQTWLAWTYKRLGELYQAKGDFDRARDYDKRFVELWKNADPELQPQVTQVRRRWAALRLVASR